MSGMPVRRQPSAIVLSATAADIMHVCRHLRAADRAEAAETRWPGLDGGFDAEALAAELIALRPYALMLDAVFPMVGAYHDGEPVALIGAYERWPGTASVALLATEDWPLVARAVYRHALRRAGPALRAHGLRAADCWVHEDHAEACRFVEHLGAVLVKRVEDYGANGGTFRYYRWRR